MQRKKKTRLCFARVSFIHRWRETATTTSTQCLHNRDTLTNVSVGFVCTSPSAQAHFLCIVEGERKRKEACSTGIGAKELSKSVAWLHTTPSIKLRRSCPEMGVTLRDGPISNADNCTFMALPLDGEGKSSVLLNQFF